jgi:hypothetical protein
LAGGCNSIQNEERATMTTLPFRPARSPWTVLVVFVVIGATDCWYEDAAADDKPLEAPRDDFQFDRWRAHYVKWASGLELRLDAAESRDLTFQREPVSVFSNPAGGTSSHGAVFVWTSDERPQVIGAVWSRKVEETRRVSVSQHSLASVPLQGIRDNAVFWNPMDAGIVLHAWPTADPPSTTQANRLVQMRNIVRSLDAVRIHRGDRSQLRALPQPLYRYKNDEITDGAVFGLFHEWDPEIFVVVEARRGGNWEIGFARFSDKLLRVTHEDKELWNYDPEGTDPPLGGRERAYVSQVVEVRPPVIAEDE